ncbi:GDSL-type esterase/lipase family protein [Arthrobacter sp. SLBN-100]|uniref:GDSL-type esterase/lipase family protein n=1 Tax=Arthrobacter sp. SLBN-100 TaxID=2768450 RepID=UPI00135C7820|nr:GDSL-type esterase/lipase family protein [Arthrobacter sp. SLBN-100]
MTDLDFAAGEGFALIRDAVCGALQVEAVENGISISRLPGWTRAQYGEDPLIGRASSETSGVRLVFMSSASWIELEMTFTRVSAEWLGFPARPAVVSLTTGGGHEESAFFEEGNLQEIRPDQPPAMVPGSPTRVRFELPPVDGDQTVEIWLPHNSSIQLHRLRADSGLRPGPQTGPRWIHYGSSISQASEAETPLGVWSVIAARALGLDLLNLGLAGSAQLDPFAARSIRDEPAALITLKLGINVVNGATFRKRTFEPAVHGFLDTIREGKPETPIVVIAPIFCPAHEETPGPTLVENATARGSDIPRRPNDGQLTLVEIRKILASIVEARSANDPNLYFLDGLRLFGSDDAQYLPDDLHPNAAGYELMGKRFTAIARSEPWLPAST